MHRLLAALALALLAAPAAAQAGSGREAEKLQGPVRAVRSQMDDGGSQARQMDRVTYDSKGNEVERTIYDDYGFLVGKQVSKRDSEGRLIESLLTDPEDKALERIAYSYAEGRLARIVGYDGDGHEGQTQRNSYDEQGRLREEAYYEKEKAVGTTTYAYDAQGRVSEVAYHLGDGSKAVAPVRPGLSAHRLGYGYDSEGRMVEAIAFDADGSVTETARYSYNPRGLVSEGRREDSSAHTNFTYTYEYDSRGNWIRQIAIMTRHWKPSPQAAVVEHLMEPSNQDYERRTVISREIAYD